ncbi:HugZ family protein [Vannielia litorea]|uniref:HugZ family pyridoxamine 5'-phosphate oxidase n=1 Tax=Vannielia litorea TaxID=1217970 RepID=UPI001C93CB01|nr:pyridoxamine 5'-phosphate oxidase family protein [Vannielia litorea]MBY6048589.1 pyridoxamine 5'-phosphate oxidase family protein [Vannielia litorea]MBY6076003.1 pyridoxamine 5'-phosphate oxidase family protein [Vannielia litorea]
MTDPIRPTDDEARAMARGLLDEARFGALGVLEGGAPVVSRIAVGTDAGGGPVTLVSSLSAHTSALRAEPACSLMVGEPGDRGDPLTHPRLSLQCKARFVDRESETHAALRARWLESHPKSKLYIDFGDFGFVALEVQGAFLNGGFGKAFKLTPADLGL